MLGKRGVTHRAVELITSEGDRSFKVNGQRFKPYLGGDVPKERVGLVLRTFKGP